MRNKNGFVMIETLIVTTFVVVIFTFLYISVVPLLGTYEYMDNQNDLDIVYKLYNIRKDIYNESDYFNMFTGDMGTITDLKSISKYCNKYCDSKDYFFYITDKSYIDSVDTSTFVNFLGSEKEKNILYNYIKNYSDVPDIVLFMYDYKSEGVTHIGIAPDKSMVTTYTNASLMDNEKICKRATTLHTDSCVYSEYNYHSDCRADGYSNMGKITYGNLGSGSLEAGDAFDCDINSDGIFDEEKERFYYVTDMDSNTAVLIYYSNVVKGEANSSNDNMFSYNVSASLEEYIGPDAAIRELPTTSQWSNIRLRNTTRNIKDLHGNIVIPNFSYSGYAARLLTVDEVERACKITAGTWTFGELSPQCRFLFEKTGYSSYSEYMGSYWLENPDSSNYALLITGEYSYVDVQASDWEAFAVRPAIEVSKKNIEI